MARNTGNGRGHSQHCNRLGEAMNSTVSAYEFLRNSALDARNFFDHGGIPAFSAQFFEARSAVRFRRDRHFCLANYEDSRQTLGLRRF